MKRIYKKYVELINLSGNANGRKEVLSLLKKTDKLKYTSEYKTNVQKQCFFKEVYVNLNYFYNTLIRIIFVHIKYLQTIIFDILSDTPQKLYYFRIIAISIIL